MGLERVTIDHIDRALKQSGNVIPQSHIIENGDVSLWIDVDHDIEVAVGPVLAARDRTEDGGVTNTARAQITLMAA